MSHAAAAASRLKKLKNRIGLSGLQTGCARIGGMLQEFTTVVDSTII